jgi:hypothetical protein
MQDRPDAGTLLDAIQDFLIKEVMPFVKENDALSYKTLVSWNMLGVVSRELKYGEQKLNEEITRLSSYLKGNVSIKSETTYNQKREICRELNQQFSNQIKEKKLSLQNTEAWNLAKKSLEEKIEISNPRFQKGD